MDSSFLIKLGINVEEVAQGVNKANGLIEKFTGQVEEMAKGFVGAFAAEKVISFGIEVAKLAGEADGVKHAFDRLNNSKQILEEMKVATQGTVSELDLMKTAVQASNFGLPIQNMGNLLEFAHQRAVATGQSVDYLVQSIVTGIGRKSPLILDNLGISALALKEKLHGVGLESASVADIAKAVGEIANDSLEKSGLAAENAATKMAKLSAAWDNFKVKLGDGFLAEIFGRLSETGANLLNMFSGQANKMDQLSQIVFNANLSSKEGIEATTKAAKDLGFNLNTLTVEHWPALQRALDKFRAEQAKLKGVALGPDKAAGLFDPTTKKEADDLSTIEKIRRRIKELQDEQLTATRAQSLAIESQIKELQKLEKTFHEQGEGKQKAGNYDDKIKGIQKMSDEVNKLAKAAHDAQTKTVTLQQTFERLEKVFKDTTKPIASVSAALKDLTARNKEEADATEMHRQQIAMFAASLGSAFGPALAGIQTFEQGLGQAAVKVIQHYKAQAMAAIADWAAKLFPPPLNIAIAGAAIGALESIFSKIGSGGGGGGGSHGGGGISGGGGLGRGGFQLQQQQIHITGKVHGRDIVFAYDKNKNLDLQRRG